MHGSPHSEGMDKERSIPLAEGRYQSPRAAAGRSGQPGGSPASLGVQSTVSSEAPEYSENAHLIVGSSALSDDGMTPLIYVSEASEATWQRPAVCGRTAPSVVLVWFVAGQQRLGISIREAAQHNTGSPSVHTVLQPSRTGKDKLLQICKRLVGFILAHWSKAAILAVLITLIVLVSVKVCRLRGACVCCCVRRRSPINHVDAPLSAICHCTTLASPQGFGFFGDILTWFQRHNGWAGWGIFVGALSGLPVVGALVSCSLGMRRRFAGMYTAMVALFLPGVVLILGAGFVFGFWRGLLAVWAGGAVGQALAFLLARYLFHGWVESTLKHKWKKWAIIDKAIEHDGWKLVLIMRFSPIIPYNLVRRCQELALQSARARPLPAVQSSTCYGTPVLSFSPLGPPRTAALLAAQHCHGHHQHSLLAVHCGFGGGHPVRVRRVCILWQVRLADSPLLTDSSALSTMPCCWHPVNLSLIALFVLDCTRPVTPPLPPLQHGGQHPLHHQRRGRTSPMV